MRLGTADMTNSSLGTMRDIVDFLQHPKYVVTRAYYDVAVAIANIPIDYTDFIVNDFFDEVADGRLETQSDIYNYNIQ